VNIARVEELILENWSNMWGRALIAQWEVEMAICECLWMQEPNC
jgi:hypothetical protein